MLLEVIVQLAVVVVQQSGELVHLNLESQRQCAQAHLNRSHRSKHAAPEQTGISGSADGSIKISPGNL